MVFSWNRGFYKHIVECAIKIAFIWDIPKLSILYNGEIIEQKVFLDRSISYYTNFQNWCLLSNGLYHCQNDFDLSYEWECVYNLQNTTHIPIKNDKWKEK